MKYIICETVASQKYNAINKARDDAEKIFINNGYEPYIIKTIYPIRKNKISKIIQIILYIYNSFLWSKKIRRLKKGDEIAIQYPLNNRVFSLDSIIKKHGQSLTVTVLIHDIESIRYKDSKKETNISKYRVRKEDMGVIDLADFVIVHNNTMNEYLVDRKINNKKMVNLEIFDYLSNYTPNRSILKEKLIIIAGNLSPDKAKYLRYLKSLKNIKFHLYGVGLDKDTLAKNVIYKGFFLPDELPSKLEGSFGLVWDGDDIKECSGIYGDYLKYNNPHKASLYIASGIPVIIWSKSALAPFVKKNNLGLTIDSIYDINEKIDRLAGEDYEKISTSVKKMSAKIRSGNYLEKAIKKINEMERHGGKD